MSIDKDTRDLAAAVRAGAESTEAEKRIADIIVGTEGANGASGEEIAIPIGVGTDGKPFVLIDVLAQADARRKYPARRANHVVLTEAASFVGYVNRHKNEARSVIYGDLAARSFTCVFDDHRVGDVDADAGWRQFRASYKCPIAPEWTRWTNLAGQKLSQAALAELLDANLLDLISGDGFPSPTELLEMARNLAVTVGQRFKRVIDSRLGTTQLISETEHSAESTKIPRAFLLGLRVFEGGQLYSVEARLRFELTNGAPFFSFDIWRREELERDAFGDVRKAVEKETGIPLFAGVA